MNMNIRIVHDGLVQNICVFSLIELSILLGYDLLCFNLTQTWKRTREIFSFEQPGPTQSPV